ncbi:MAG: hypothetical protein ACREX3_10565 [Gammaproteobacteria bacterium]
MRRLRQLLRELRAECPDDWYLKQCEESRRQSRVLRSHFESYARAVEALDASAWEVLRQKAITHFKSDHARRGKQAFFNQLNEAFAYRFLVQEGHKSVSFIPENEGQKSKGKKSKTSDLRFLENDRGRYCEVKTLSVSDAQIERYKSTAVFDGSMYFELDTAFLNSKLAPTVCYAIEQIRSFGSDGIVYLVLHCDDAALDYLDTYKKQLAHFLKQHFLNVEVFVKFGVYGRRHLHVKPQRTVGYGYIGDRPRFV